MRNRDLHDALREFALEAAGLLTEEVGAGAELEFEVVEQARPARRRFRRAAPEGPTLYRYRPLTERFIAERWPRLRALPTCLPAAHALGTGAAHYLRTADLGGADAEPALQAMLERLYEDATSFAFPEERFRQVYLDVERTLYEKTVRMMVVASLPGLRLEAPRAELGDGLALVRGDSFDATPGPAWPRGAEPEAVCVLERDVAPDDRLAASEARQRIRRVVTALRLFKAGGVTLDPIGWYRVAEVRWQPLSLEAAGAARGELWVLGEGEDADLRDFLATFERSTDAGAIAWALARFEMGCSRPVAAEALSDYLLALHALLDAATDSSEASLALRLAALCAHEGERRAVQRRVELALSLERFVMQGGHDDAYVETIGPETPLTLVSEIEQHLRALLRDMMCGYLERDLKSVADDILLEPPEPAEIDVRDLREQPPPADPATEPATVTVGSAEADTSEMEAVALEPEEGTAQGVTPSADWAPDEDARSYSAPV